jgi:glycolate oxidase FAD binding subunit
MPLAGERTACTFVCAARRQRSPRRKHPWAEKFWTATPARHWTALREQAQPFFALQGDESLWRLSVPDTAPPLKLGETLVEWGGAQRWVKRPDGNAGLIREAAAQASGHATLFRSARKSVPVFSTLKPPLDRIHRELKKQFDPAGVFNPGRMYADF